MPLTERGGFLLFSIFETKFDSLVFYLRITEGVTAPNVYDYWRLTRPVGFGNRDRIRTHIGIAVSTLLSPGKGERMPAHNPDRFEQIQTFLNRFKVLAVEIASVIGLILILFHALRLEARW